MRRWVTLWLSLLTVSIQAQDPYGDLRDAGDGFAQVVPGKPLVFPRDHGTHPDFRIEWWYLTANLQDVSGRHWGLQWTLFRQALSPEPIEQGWSSNQIYMAHAAISTPDGHHHEQRFARGGIGQAGVSDLQAGGQFEAWLDDWHWQSEGTELMPASLNFSVNDRTVELVLNATGPLVLNGQNGYSQKSAQGQASYYYSHPFIAVSGKIGDTPVRGKAWLDREWSSQPLATNQSGWDWFSLHLDDGHKLMVYRLRHDDGEHWLSGNWITPGGGSQTLTAEEISITPIRRAKVETGDGDTVELPLDWEISIAGKGRLIVRPLYDAQWMGTRFPYWEGVMLVESAEGMAAGVGYMELTGY